MTTLSLTQRENFDRCLKSALIKTAGYTHKHVTIATKIGNVFVNVTNDHVVGSSCALAGPLSVAHVRVETSIRPCLESSS
jgi:hypothetical protein